MLYRDVDTIKTAHIHSFMLFYPPYPEKELRPSLTFVV